MDSARKSQYLSIATHLLKQDKKPLRALQLLEESAGALTIQDLLPLLPEFTEIDAFRDQICTALDQASGHIDRLKAEMQELTEASLGIKKVSTLNSHLLI